VPGSPRRLPADPLCQTDRSRRCALNNAKPSCPPVAVLPKDPRGILRPISRPAARVVLSNGPDAGAYQRLRRSTVLHRSTGC